MPRCREKISFKYLKHTIDDVNAQVERRRGATYKVTPFRLVINDEYYYLLAFDDLSQETRTYRVDRMKDVRLPDENGESTWKFRGIDLEHYTQRVFSMFGDEKRDVTIRFTNNLLDALSIDSAQKVRCIGKREKNILRFPQKLKSANNSTLGFVSSATKQKFFLPKMPLRA